MPEPIDLETARAEREAEQWKDDLQHQGHGFAGNEANVHHALTKAPAFKGQIAYNRRIYMPTQFKHTPAGPGGEWSDAHTARTTIWLQRQGIPAKPRTVDSALLAVAHENEVDPLEDWLLGLEWDGQNRIGTWLADYCQSERSDANSVMGSKFLIGAVARAMKPGCRMDVMLVLEGPQGVKKSTLIKILGGEHTGENLPDFHSKDAMLTAGTKWIIEVSELAAVRKSDLEHVKAFISRLEDTFRPVYGRYNVTAKRRCVLIGNLNPDGVGYLQDTTGNRRFWPVKVGMIDVDALRRDRDQIWAEALYCYHRGDHWWLDGEEHALVGSQQSERVIEDPWAAAIERWAEGQVGTFTTMDVAIGALSMKTQDVNRGTSTRIGIILRKLGISKKRVREENELSWVYYRPDPV